MAPSCGKLKKLYSLVGQVTLVTMYPALFHAAAYLGKSNFHKQFGMKPFPLACFVGFGIMLLITVCLGIICKISEKKTTEKAMEKAAAVEKTTASQEDKEGNTKISAKKKLDIASHKKGILAVTVLMLIASLMRIPMLGTFQRWDAGEYYYTIGTSVHDYNLTLSDFFFQFSIAYHPNYGFSTFVAIPLFIANRNIMLYTAWQIFFSILAVLALYVVFRKNTGMSELRSMLSALAVGCVPIFLGLSVYCTPDYYTVLFFIFAMYFATQEKHILEFAMLIMMCFSKETSAVIVLGYYGMRLLYRLFMKTSKKGIINKIKNVIFCSDFWVALCTGVAFVTGFIMKGASWADKVGGEDSGRAVIEFFRPYVAMKFKQYMFSNFAWAVSGVFIVSIIVIFWKCIRRRKSGKPADLELADTADTTADITADTTADATADTTAGTTADTTADITAGTTADTTADKDLEMSRRTNMLLLGIMGAMACFAAVGMLLHVSAIERYNIFFAVGLVMIALIAAGIAFRGKYELLYCFATLMACAVLGLESYITVDPVTRRIFPQVPIGHHTMNYESEYMDYFGDGMVTNYQYAWIDKAFDQLLLDIDYDVNDTLFFPAPEAGVKSGVQFEGNSGYFRVAWFPDLKRRGYFDYEMPGNWYEMSIHGVSTENSWFPFMNYTTGEYMTDEFVTDNATLCFMPYFEKLGVRENPYIRCAGSRYYVGPRAESSRYRGTIAHYPMVVHDNYIEGVNLRMVADGLNRGIENGGLLTDDILQETSVEASSQETSVEASSEEYQNEVESVYRYLAAGYLVVDHIYEDGTTDQIGPMQSIYLDLELYDENGNVIVLEHSEETATVKVGVGELLKEVDQALMTMCAGQTKDVEVLIPPHYPELEKYAGQTLTARLMPQKVACTYIYDIDEETEKMLRERAKEIVDLRIINEELRRSNASVINQVLAKILEEENLGNANIEDIYGKLASECQPSQEVEEYFQEYLARVGLSEEEFCRDYLQMLPDEYKVCKYILGQLGTDTES